MSSLATSPNPASMPTWQSRPGRFFRFINLEWTCFGHNFLQLQFTNAWGTKPIKGTDVVKDHHDILPFEDFLMVGLSLLLNHKMIWCIMTFREWTLHVEILQLHFARSRGIIFLFFGLFKCLLWVYLSVSCVVGGEKNRSSVTLNGDATFFMLILHLPSRGLTT